MWANEYTGKSPLDAAKIWSALRRLHEGTLTYEGADHFVIHGPFAVGTHLSVTPVGQQTFDSEIIELVENKVYADRTDFDSVVLNFRHTLTPLSDGGTSVTHRLEISGSGADSLGAELGPQISGDFGEAMEALFQVAENE